MPLSESTSLGSKVIFTCGDRPYTFTDVVDWALVQGRLDPLWRDFLRGLECDRHAIEQGLEVNDTEIDSASVEFRYRHDLITAEETERWLQDRGLDLAGFSDYFARRYWAKAYSGAVELPNTTYPKANADDKGLFLADLILSDSLERMAAAFSQRVASVAAPNQPDAEGVARERAKFFERTKLDEAELADWLGQLGRDSAWLDEMLTAEAVYRKAVDAIINDKALQRELVPMQLNLTRFEIETVEVDSKDAAAEVIACARDDGMSLTEVAEEGRYPFRRTQILLEDIPPDLQPRFLSVKAGTILEPIARDDSFEIVRVTGRTEPALKDPAVRGRLEQRLSGRHFSEVVAKRIAWQILQSTE